MAGHGTAENTRLRLSRSMNVGPRVYPQLERVRNNDHFAIRDMKSVSAEKATQACSVLVEHKKHAVEG